MYGERFTYKDISESTIYNVEKTEIINFYQ
jgi:hypothetical protein